MDEEGEDEEYLGNPYLVEDWKTNKIRSIELFLCVSSNRCSYFFLVLTDTSYLPRYKYHRFLLYWFLEGIPKLPTFQQCHFDESCIIIGGNFNEENKIELFGETTLTEKVTFADLQKGLFKICILSDVLKKVILNMI